MRPAEVLSFYPGADSLVTSRPIRLLSAIVPAVLEASRPMDRILREVVLALHPRHSPGKDPTGATNAVWERPSRVAMPICPVHRV